MGLFWRRSARSAAKAHRNPRDNTRVQPARGAPVAVHVLGRDSLDILSARDISQTGIGVFVPHRFEGCDIASEVELVVKLPGHRTFLARGQVKHQNEEAEASPFFGVEFTDVPTEGRKRLQSYIASRLDEAREQRKAAG